MNELTEELKRLAVSASVRREDLLLVGLKKTRTKKSLALLSGMLALFSAGSVTAVITRVFGSSALQIAAVSAALSGIISLFIQIYFSDEDLVRIFTGSSNYLSLRDNAYRAFINDTLSDSERYESLSNLQSNYAELDKTYSRYFSWRFQAVYVSFYKKPRLILSEDAIEKEKERFADKLQQTNPDITASSTEDGT
jgi:hypothetical protein